MPDTEYNNDDHFLDCQINLAHIITMLIRIMPCVRGLRRQVIDLLVMVLFYREIKRFQGNGSSHYVI